MPRVTFQPSGSHLDVPEEISVLEAACCAAETNVVCCGITSACRRRRATVLNGEEHLTARDEQKPLKRGRLRFLPGARLGSMARAGGDVEVEMRQ